MEATFETSRSTQINCREEREVRRLRPHTLAPYKRRVERDVSNVTSIEG